MSDAIPTGTAPALGVAPKRVRSMYPKVAETRLLTRNVLKVPKLATPIRQRVSVSSTRGVVVHGAGRGGAVTWGSAGGMPVARRRRLSTCASSAVQVHAPNRINVGRKPMARQKCHLPAER